MSYGTFSFMKTNAPNWCYVTFLLYNGTVTNCVTVSITGLSQPCHGKMPQQLSPRMTKYDLSNVQKSLKILLIWLLALCEDIHVYGSGMITLNAHYSTILLETKQPSYMIDRIKKKSLLTQLSLENCFCLNALITTTV